MPGGVHLLMFVDEQGNVLVCGGNKDGELGLDHTTQINSPQKNNNVSDIVAVAGGYDYFSIFLDKQGNIFTCGYNGRGQLGLRDKDDRHTTETQQHPSNVFSFFLQHSVLFLADCGLRRRSLELWVR